MSEELEVEMMSHGEGKKLNKSLHKSMRRAYDQNLGPAVNDDEMSHDEARSISEAKSKSSRKAPENREEHPDRRPDAPLFHKN